MAAIDAACPTAIVTWAVALDKPGEEKEIVTEPAGPLTPRFAKVAVPLVVVADAPPTNVNPGATDAVTVAPLTAVALPNWSLS